jgi:peptidyl-prolyl cis-trans isomerase SurA
MTPGRATLIGLCLVSLAGCSSTPPAPLPPAPASTGSLLLPARPATEPPAGQPVVDRVVAVVNEEVILMSELQEAVMLYVRDTKETLPAGGPAREQFLQKVLSRMIDHRLQIQEARREKVEVTDEDIRVLMDDFVKRNGGNREDVVEKLRLQGLSWEQVRRDMRESLLAQRIRSRKISRRATITETEVDAYVAENRPKLERDLKYHPRHIAILAQPPDSAAAWEKAKTEADGVAARLREGADFAEVAREQSKDGSAAAGGDLGWLTPGELQPLFEEPILKISPGEVTAPIKSENGYHLFRLEARESLTPEMITQLRQQARDILVQKKGQERLDEWMQSLRQRALIAERL